jgi:PAS domain S-box-containing protein
MKWVSEMGVGNQTIYSHQPEMGKTLTYDDLGQILSNLQSKLADFREKEANSLAIFNEFKQVADRLQSGIYRYDVKTHRFHFFNRSIIELLASKEANASDITSKSVLLRLHPDDRDRVRRAAKEAIARGIGEAEYRFKKSDGTYRWLFDRWVVLRDPRGQPRYIEGIVMDTTRRRIAEEKLKESERKLRTLSSHLLDAQEKQRRRIALELHDELGQNLTVLKLQLRSIQKRLPTTLSQLQTKCENTNRYVDQIIENVRRISHELCPSCIEDLGLDESIGMLAEDFANHSKLLVSIETQKIDSLFTLQQRTTIYRILQEALNNIQKHARAHKVLIKIERKKNVVDIQIADDGKGFIIERNAEETVGKAGLGLTAMEERARMLGGTLEVTSIIGIGCRLVFSIPIASGERNDDFLSYSFG